LFYPDAVRLRRRAGWGNNQRTFDRGIQDSAIKNSFVTIPLSHSGFQSRSISSQAFSPLTPFASVHIGIEPGRRPAFQNIEHSTLNIQPQQWRQRDALSYVISG